MRSSLFNDEQIISMIKEQEARMPTAEVFCKHAISTASFYKYKAKFGGMGVSDARKLKALEDENAKLKMCPYLNLYFSKYTINFALNRF